MTLLEWIISMVIESNPTLYEVQEMLDAIAMSYDLDLYFPRPKDCTRAEHLMKGWLYLVYDDDGNPIGYFVFMFKNKTMTFPFFGFMTTKFCTMEHLRILRNYVKKMMKAFFSQGVRVYILNKKLIPIAENWGFTQSRTNKNIYFRRF